jgi:MFS family permease
MSQIAVADGQENGGALLYPSTGWRAVIFLCVLLSGDVAIALSFVVLPGLPGMAQHFGGGAHGSFIAQSVLTSIGLGMMAGGLIGGSILERIGPFRLLVVAIAVFGLAGSMGLVLDGRWAFTVSRVVLGFSSSCFGISTMWLIAEVYQGVGRAKIIGYKTALACISAVVGTLIAGQLVQYLGWRAPYALYGGLALPVLAGVFLTVSPRLSSVSTNRPAVSGEELGSLLPLWWFYGLLIVLYILSTMRSAQLPFLLVENGIVSPSTQSLIISLATLSTTAGCLIYGPLYARIPNWIYPVSFGVGGLGWAIMGLSHDLPTVAAGVVVAGTGTGVFMPHNVHTVMGKVSAKVRGRAIGLYLVTTALGAVLNPYVVASVRDSLGLHGTFIAAAGVWEAATAIAFLWIWVRLPQPKVRYSRS